jgi:hypothetical protein
MSERKGYPWPGSALTDKEMGILVQWRKETGVPISQLIRQAILICQEIILTGRLLKIPAREEHYGGDTTDRFTK